MKKQIWIIVFGLFVINFHSFAQSKINHVALCATDLKKATLFYNQILGLPIVKHPFPDTIHQWFELNKNILLHVIEGKCMGNTDKRFHICLSVASLEKTIEHLQKNKLAFYNWVGEKGAITNRVDGVHQIYLQDPDGNWIEINDEQYMGI